MLSYNDLKPGTIFILDDQPYEVLEFNFLRMQQRKPVAQTKIKNLITGKVLNRNFQSTESFKEATIDYKKAKFLYGHRDKFIFYEPSNPSARFEIAESTIGEQSRFLKPNAEVETVVFEGKVINVELPIKMDFKVTEAPPAIRGNTAQGGTKQVKIETGAVINAPLFVEEGDIIVINTETGEYSERKTA
jgi:elongation factor P